MLSTIKSAGVGFLQLQDQNPDVRLAARKKLPLNQPSQSEIEGIIALSENGDEGVRIQAANTLAEILITWWPIFSEEILSSLKACLGDVSPKVSGTAAKGILDKILSAPCAPAEIIRSVSSLL